MFIEITNLYEAEKSELLELETQFNLGAISELDYNSKKIKVENYRLSKDNVETYMWLYKLMKDCCK